jgi:MFS family permease
VPYGKVISNWFDKRGGLALGLTMFGLGSGAIVIPSLTQRLLTVFGLARSVRAQVYSYQNPSLWLSESHDLLILVVSVPVVGLFLKEAVPRETWESLFKSQGMRNPMPRIQMLDGFNEGWIEFESGETGSRKGKIELRTVLQELIERESKS